MTGEASRIEWLLKWQLLEKLRRKITTTSAPGVANGWNDPRLKVIDLKWRRSTPRTASSPNSNPAPNGW